MLEKDGRSRTDYYVMEVRIRTAKIVFRHIEMYHKCGFTEKSINMELIF